MEKITLSLAAVAAIIALTVLQACASPSGAAGTQCAKPTLTPADASHAVASVSVTIATVTSGAYLRYTLDGSTPPGCSSGNGTQIAAAKGKVTVEFGFGSRGPVLKAIAYKAGLADSLIAVGNYVYQSPY